MTERALGIDDLATALGAPVSEAEALLAGRAPISADRAERLSRTLGASTRFWLTREAEYVEDRLRVMAADWSSDLPLRNMRRFGWISDSRDWRDQIDQCLTFFGVDDFEEWQERYPHQTRGAHYRTSATFDNDDNATLVWFRAGEREERSPHPRRPFDAEALRARVPELKALTRLARPERFIPELQRITGQVGLTVLVIRAPEGCHASGATRWNKDRPVIQLSARHLSDDHFWFTFFHEVGHVLCHKDRRETFIDLDFDTAAQDDLEIEADRFAESVILGGFDAQADLRYVHYREVIRLAAHWGVSPGLVAGQLQHRGIVARDRLNGLKRRYQWDGTNLVAKSG